MPSLTVPNLPKDPAEYLPYLKSLNLFETNTFDENDKNRNIWIRKNKNQCPLVPKHLKSRFILSK